MHAEGDYQNQDYTNIKTETITKKKGIIDIIDGSKLHSLLLALHFFTIKQFLQQPIIQVLQLQNLIPSLHWRRRRWKSRGRRRRRTNSRPGRILVRKIQNGQTSPHGISSSVISSSRFFRSVESPEPNTLPMPIRVANLRRKLPPRPPPHSPVSNLSGVLALSRLDLPSSAVLGHCICFQLQLAWRKLALGVSSIYIRVQKEASSPVVPSGLKFREDPTYVHV